MNNENTKHNGWTNYATWLVNLEVFDGHDKDDDEPLTADELKCYAETLIECESNGGLALDCALAFVAEVNWQEIADSINDVD